MATTSKLSDVRGGGMKLAARFALFMSGSLAAVMAAAGFILFTNSARISSSVVDEALAETADRMAGIDRAQTEVEKLEGELQAFAAFEERLQPFQDDPAFAGLLLDLRLLSEKSAGRRKELLRMRPALLPVAGTEPRRYAQKGYLESQPVEMGADRERGILYQVALDGDRTYDLFVPVYESRVEQGLLSLILGTIVAVILAGTIVSLLVAKTVSGPLGEIVEDIHQISTGDLEHRVLTKGTGEIASLARAIDRMTKGLLEARETELELQIREREVAVAAEVREALLPQKTPEAQGYQIGVLHLSSQGLWGDFHDFFEFPGLDRVGLVVCDVSGKGLPGALVGATARTWLRSALTGGDDVASALRTINRELARDVRRGMYVSALYALVDLPRGTATVACAGHKIPLIRFTAADGKVRLIQPEGIALAFDKGPVFERRLQIQTVPIEPGDRLVLADSGAVLVADAEGRELGEKPLYALIQKHGGLPTEDFLARLRAALEKHAGEAPLPRDVSVVTIARG